MTKENKSDFIIFKTEDDQISVDVRFEEETVWLTPDQMAELFGKGRSTIAEHIGNSDKFGKRVTDSWSVSSTTTINYLNEKELRSLGQIVSGYLDFAERQAKRTKSLKNIGFYNDNFVNLENN